MIILDTNVISEPTRPQSHPKVIAWLDSQIPETLYLTATGLSELWLGIKLLPSGRRKQTLATEMDRLIRAHFGDRILAFDQQVAKVCATIVARASSGGFTISTPDGQIAAIAVVHGFSVATRDAAPFLAAGIAVLNQWEL